MNSVLERISPCPSEALDAYIPKEQQAPKWIETFHLNSCLDKIYKIELVVRTISQLGPLTFSGRTSSRVRFKPLKLNFQEDSKHT